MSRPRFDNQQCLHCVLCYGNPLITCVLSDHGEQSLAGSAGVWNGHDACYDISQRWQLLNPGNLCPSMVNPLLTAGDVRDVVPGELLKHCVLGLSLRDELWESVEEAAQVPCLGLQLVGGVNHTNMLQHLIVQRQFFQEVAAHLLKVALHYLVEVFDTAGSQVVRCRILDHVQ